MSLYHQQITHWAKDARDGYGMMSYSAPTTNDGRWEDKQVLFMNAEGEQELSQAIIYPNGQEMAVEDYVFLGTSVATDPTTVTGAKKIKAYSKTPSVQATSYLRKAWL